MSVERVELALSHTAGLHILVLLFCLKHIHFVFTANTENKIEINFNYHSYHKISHIHLIDIENYVNIV